MDHCTTCGAPVAPTHYVCGYCRAVLTDRVKNVGPAGGDSFEALCAVVQNNLGAIHAIPRPTPGAILLATLRVFAILYTFGLVLRWWRSRPAASFDHASFETLESLVERNVGLLRARCNGSPELTAQVAVLERELQRARERVRRVRLMQWGIPIGLTLALVVVGALAPDRPR